MTAAQGNTGHRITAHRTTAHDSTSPGTPGHRTPAHGTAALGTPAHDNPPAGDTESVLAGVGLRLRTLRVNRDRTLADVSLATGISLSTLSRLESGQRRATLELLLPLAREYGVPLDELVGAPATGDPRIHIRALRRHGQTILPLSRGVSGLQAFKHIIAPGPTDVHPAPKTHPGFEWLYVLKGNLRLVLGTHDLVLPAGEVAEFSTETPHWFGRADTNAVEFLSLFGPQGERMHVRATTAP
ncbi:helix-turn-helix domain-containing protein [Subtercola sp. YIM 133946]|uniref:helix-turn-helix domain-containing protein n=1 Tax=Subtercola sp. YIM 133946 TaxID=3118909 RepID=UPI002F95ECA2